MNAPRLAGLALLVGLVLGTALPSVSAPAPRHPPGAGVSESELDTALKNAEDSLGKSDGKSGLTWVDRALERDTKSLRAWALRARCSEVLGDKDAQIYALHRQLLLSIAQKLPPAEVETLRANVIAVDPIAKDLFELSHTFVPRLQAVADQYEKDKRPHSAIRVLKEILALDPASTATEDKIQLLASTPDPSLAGDAKPKDLLAGVSEEWIREHDAQHATWKDRAKLEREHYTTYTNSGYANLVRTAEAMEQMNAFYREFFQYATAEHPGTVPRIDLNIFNTRAEYLKDGIGPPIEWSGGHFTGGAVETYIGEGSFNDMTYTLFHEAAHQFVSLATNASGWLNEGLASFFEGCRILANGTVIMNLPAGHRLGPMVQRLEQGWMTDENDGMDSKDSSKSEPKKAPTFRIVLENKYEWGPAWYAPTWAVVYFLYNYQDPVDGRFVYRASFRTFIDKSGGRVGEGAVKNFEDTVLKNPEPPIKGVVRPKGAAEIRLPKTVAELDPVWKDWLMDLAKQQNGEAEVQRPYLQWARNSLKAKNVTAANEHFEKALIAAPEDVETLLDFAALLAERKSTDRATKLALEALRILESKKPVDEKAVAAAERSLAKWDAKQKALDGVHTELWTAARNVVQRYQAANLPSMVLDLSWRMGSDLGVPGMFETYETALRAGGRPMEAWQLVYNEKDLDGWAASSEAIFRPESARIEAGFGDYDEAKFDYRVLTLDIVTSGDWSFEASIQAEKGKVNFCGLAFGNKGPNNFHGLILFPARTDASGSREGLAESGFIDLASCFGNASFKTWRHNPVKVATPKVGETATAPWHVLRVDVADNLVDTWFDGEFLSTQEFGSSDPLRGNIGLVVGAGTASFRNVRFLSRPPRDPAARIDRAVRMEKIEEQGGAPAGGSWLGRVPPFPTVEKWVQGERKSWKEKGVVPQLLVLWSTQQNDLVPIDAWLRELATANAKVGLEIVALASPNDSAGVEEYLKSHAFPGVVGVDHREKPGVGDTFERYSVDKFNLPRLILLGIDAKVVWEGDPGFTRAEPWSAGQESFLDAPLAEMIAKNRLEDLAGWLSKWNASGAPALAKGDLETALPLMRDAKTLPEGRIPAVDEARNKLAVLESALVSLSTTAAAFARDGVAPAIPALTDFAKVLKKTIDKNTQVALAQIRDAKPSKDWKSAVERCDKLAKSVKKEDKLALARELAAKLPAMEGRFPKDLVADLAPALEKEDLDAIQAIASQAGARPRKWLLVEYLRW